MSDYPKLPPQETLKAMLDYNPETGELFWKARTPDMFVDRGGWSVEHSCAHWNARWEGKPALKKMWNGYRVGRVDYKQVGAHRAIWKLVTGEEPDVIDHINGIRDDNRFENLRNVTFAENRKNVRMTSRNTSGALGIRQDKKSGKWVAVIQVGTFLTKDEAVAARKAAEIALGYHPNHGRQAA